ncbi:MAG: diguanylate cyclase [Ignavibacteriales bacterium CG_4_9_14_3_um_filter_30_11]|nr:MAG: diguanylate cyclase [Ignavibacteriales bacterium CG_4_9_14_3_um_filter_30_11]
MDRIQRKRILIFLLVPALAVSLFLTDEIIIRIIAATLIVVYVAFIIFLRDSSKYTPSFTETENDNIEYENTLTPDPNESFQIVNKPEKIEVITQDTYKPEFKASRTNLKPADLKERYEQIAREEVPKGVGHDGQFSFALEKILTVLKESYGAHTAIFFWYNKEDEKLSTEKYVSSSTQIANRKFDIEDDILSKIIQKGEPEHLTHISNTAEADVIRYYESPVGIKSFVGVPLYYGNSLIAILALDSIQEDVFGVETIYALGSFVRVITILITIFEEKYSDTISQKRLDGILKLISPEKPMLNSDDVLFALQNTLDSFIKWDSFALILFDPIEKKFRVKRITNKTSLKYIGEGLEVELAGTLTGKSIKTGMPIKIDDTSTQEYVRFAKREDISFEGSFLAIPMVYSGQNYGVLCFESLKKKIYTNKDLQFLKKAINIISYVIYSYSTQSLLKSYLDVDIETKALKLESFKDRLGEEIIKAEYAKTSGAIAVIKIDNFLDQANLFENNPFPKVLEIIADTIAKEMTPLNIFGRLSERKFGVYFFNATSKEVFLWAEKLRVKIARIPISVVSKQTTYTVSIGVASANSSLGVDDIIENAELALLKAVEKGGNTVRTTHN